MSPPFHFTPPMSDTTIQTHPNPLTLASNSRPPFLFFFHHLTKRSQFYSSEFG